MKLPISGKTQWQQGARRASASGAREHAADQPSGLVPQAQQGVGECQERCEEMYPDSPVEQLECFKQECWS